ncbi:hypothetical protein DNAM5_50 [Haloarcula californiae tailed virus 1]|uniref:Uncharacterized protein n=1 Tax=Haloarcula californiae tailed virus 1 TaxID=1273746 RepID=R4TNW5_9CAUD|nr:hypothetical protein M202_gp050 [Haloarcula californiae tailed virus 1]AGM11913.1 hypothetical protein DNAM5_50 [Haloarcula californiae tailed virus 1]
MPEMLTLTLGVLVVISVALAFQQWRARKRSEREMNRRLVAYEGKLRDLGHAPDRVYHNFESFLAGDERDPADDFESDVRYETEDEEDA